MSLAPIRKIQILTDNQAGLPLFYCHSADVGHEPALSLERVGAMVVIRARRMLFKVKYNPQRKNRVDIYMGVDQARHLGRALVEAAGSEAPRTWQVSGADPHAAAKGNMRLPSIVWARSGRYVRAAARVDSGVRLEARDGYLNVDLEFPHQTHIKMKEHEVHIGITLAPPVGVHDAGKTFAVTVPDHELQKGRRETNPIQKVRGDVYLELPAGGAAGLGLLLRDFAEPGPPAAA